MRSASNFSAMPPPCSRPSRPARSTCAPEDDPGRWIEGYDFPAVAGRAHRQARVRHAPALGHVGARLQHAPAHVRGCPRAPRLHPAVRCRMDQPQPVQRRLQAHAELLRALRAVLARPACRCARAGAAGPLRAVRQARGARRHVQACPSPTAAATTAPTCRPPTSCSPRPAASSRAAASSKAACLSPSSSWPRRASRSG